jgi:hypothetical protein
MVLEDCLECIHGRTIKIAKEFYSKCEHENVLSIHSKCIARRALLNYYKQKEILSIHLINQSYHKGD